jgi:glycosyltransferase involved in cell wall biosynthesis
MRIIHIVPPTPKACGMYESTRELVEDERKLGIDSFLYDPRPDNGGTTNETHNKNLIECPKCHVKISCGERLVEPNGRVDDWFEDRGVCSVPKEFLKTSDLLVSHSGIDKELLDEVNKPFIHVCHGRPYSSFLIEQTGQTPIYQIYGRMDKEERLKAIVTLWYQFEKLLKVMFKETPLYTFNPPVNLHTYTPNGPKDYSFGGKKAKINIVCAVIWRLDKDPYHVFNACYYFVKKHPEAKLHIYGAKIDGAWRSLLGYMQEENVLGEILPMVGHMDYVFRSADLVVTPHKIATRTVRESLASGTQLIADIGNPYTPYTADIENIDSFISSIEDAYGDLQENKNKCSTINRKLAEKEFDSKSTTKSFIDLYKKILENS